MHPDDGRASLHALRRLAAPGAELVLTCPNTPEGQDALFKVAPAPDSSGASQ